MLETFKEDPSVLNVVLQKVEKHFRVWKFINELRHRRSSKKLETQS